METTRRLGQKISIQSLINLEPSKRKVGLGTSIPVSFRRNYWCLRNRSRGFWLSQPLLFFWSIQRPHVWILDLGCRRILPGGVTLRAWSRHVARAHLLGQLIWNIGDTLRSQQPIGVELDGFFRSLIVVVRNAHRVDLSIFIIVHSYLQDSQGCEASLLPVLVSSPYHEVWQLLAILKFEVVLSFGLKFPWVDIHLFAHVQEDLVLESWCLCAELLLEEMLMVLCGKVAPLCSLVVFQILFSLLWVLIVVRLVVKHGQLGVLVHVIYLVGISFAHFYNL